ncbi:MAG TPA: TIGR04086 family membrane protein [Bacillota bacterium]
MNYNQNGDGAISYRSILIGGLTVLLGMVLLTVVLGTLTHLGWPGLLNCSNTFYLVMFYLALVTGSVYAGFNSQSMGWLTGAGVGLFASVLLLMISILTGPAVNWFFFSLKTLINCLIGALGGIIGINITKR